MKKFRIVQTGEGFFIQQSFLGLFWHKYSELNLRKPEKIFGEKWWVLDSFKPFKKVRYASLDEAKEHVELIKKCPIKYRGRSIDVGVNGYDTKALYYTPYKYNTYIASFDLEDLEDLKSKIDDDIQIIENDKKVKFAMKQAKKVINVWYEE